MPVEKLICFADGCDTPINEAQNPRACYDNRGRKYCCPECAYYTLQEKEKIIDCVDLVFSLKQ